MFTMYNVQWYFSFQAFFLFFFGSDYSHAAPLKRNKVGFRAFKSPLCLHKRTKRTHLGFIWFYCPTVLYILYCAWEISLFVSMFEEQERFFSHVT